MDILEWSTCRHYPLFPEERNGYTFIMPDAVLDGFQVLLAIEQCFPGIKMTGLVKIAVGNIGVSFQADHIEDIITVGNFPGVDIPGILVAVFPEKESVLLQHVMGMMRMAGNRQGILPFGITKDLFIVLAGGDEFLDIQEQQMSGSIPGKVVLTDLDSWNHQHAVLVPGSQRLGLNGCQVFLKVIVLDRQVQLTSYLADSIVAVHHMVGDSNDVKSGLPE